MDTFHRFGKSSKSQLSFCRKGCRENGYLKSLLMRFASSQRSRSFIFLGDQKGFSYASQFLQNDKKIKFARWHTQNIAAIMPEVNRMNNDKLICIVHHPSTGPGSGHIYNPATHNNPNGGLFTQKIERGEWEFEPDPYKKKNGTVDLTSSHEYYEYLAGVLI